jgi:hypothetical protein
MTYLNNPLIPLSLIKTFRALRGIFTSFALIPPYQRGIQGGCYKKTLISKHGKPLSNKFK